MKYHRKPAAQVAVAKRAAKLKAEAGRSALSPKFAAANTASIIEAGLAADVAQHQHDKKHEHGARAPPIRLLDKHEVCAIAGATFPTIWAWMRDGTFPRARIAGGKSKWLSTEIDAWLASLPPRRLKGDPSSPEAA
jgi:predicted DNA-binding transcriptional regulator AlpA